MAKNLVIVESPTKVKTIKKFLGASYMVEASGGHVRDLPKSKLGIDVDHDFEPHYITIRGKGDTLATLRKQAKKADKIFLATDPDREGEAIAWHLEEALGGESKKIQRITFNEITKTAVKASLKAPRVLDMDLVDAQQARRALDRIVGYKISPLLWKKVKRGLSAGRVQNAALGMICEREEEINAFQSEEYWTLDARVLPEGWKEPLQVRYSGKRELKSEEDVRALTDLLEKADFRISDIRTQEKSRKPALPFTTSTLQQEASKQLNFSTQKTMRIAQQLYEGVDVKDAGTVGLITYLRTDSTRIAEEADAAAREYIRSEYGENYVAARREPKGNAKGKIQDAHEAIRPADITLTPARVKDSLSRDQFRLYQLIWRRFTASRMSDMKYNSLQVRIDAAGEEFRASADLQLFDGFRLVYDEDSEEKLEKKSGLTKLSPDTALSFVEFEPKQHFTQPPAHFTEASLVRAMEEGGIGRPSTYAPTITTLLGRHYILKENKNLYVTELGETVNGIMQQYFSSVVDEGLTARMEEELDKVAEGSENWKDPIRTFYPRLMEAVENAEEKLEKVQIADEETDEPCEICGRKLVIKYGPHGKFLACPGFPECRFTKPLLEKTGDLCPKCGGAILIRKTRKGRRYYGCENHPACDYMSWQKPSAKKTEEEDEEKEKGGA